MREAFFEGELTFVIKFRAGLAECQKLRSCFKGEALCEHEISPRLLCCTFMQVVLNVVL